jgi:hypothetical protein
MTRGCSAEAGWGHRTQTPGPTHHEAELVYVAENGSFDEKNWIASSFHSSQ